ncbi:MAG: HIT family protein [Acidobacteriia bacterium]|nr:HIT family protein [Terriglobia bacterium]
MSAECLFCRIASGAVPAPVVFQDDACAAFLDHRPLFPGHCLLIPRAHYETLPDLPPNRIEPLFATARRLCAAVEETMQSEGSFLAINNRVSQSVPHLHIHVVPRRRKDGLRGFFWPRGKYTDETEMERIRAALEKNMERP